MARPVETLADLPLGGGILDRAADRRTDEGLIPGLLADPATRVLPVVGERVRVEEGPGTTARLAFRPPEAADAERTAVFLGIDRAGDLPGGGAGTAYVAVLEDQADDGSLDLRFAGARLHPGEAGLLATALGVGNWHRSHRFCPRCGSGTVPVQAGWVRRCPTDGSLHFPRTDPAVIMSVVDADDRLLLARGRGFRRKGVSVLAGFVEPGESLEAAVVREVAEEVGLTVTDVRYLGDQPWPFPSSLMVGFTARTIGPTQITPQDGEIEAARWYTRAELRAAVADRSVLLSPRLSIARHLIERWYGGRIDAPDQPLRPS